ncbi:ATP-dependent helicase SGS1 [Grifola frondosa]|uniref:DNA 3'-5' helicase n=1 Tax=Grifola frondosa TaxID=5627 RepID=A0A1C7LTD6_GRIFR|nr:ATP-dependent helicase SGS1 [Grifola frondosa]
MCIKETEAAVRHLRNRLPEHLREKIKYFHSIMTPEYRSDEYEALRTSDLYGLCVTDSFGMGLDLPDVKLIIQWKVPANMNTLWQRFGRAARGDGIEGTALLIAEKQHFDDERDKKAIRNAKRREAVKKRKAHRQITRDSTSKRPAYAADPSSSSRPLPSQTTARAKIDPEDSDTEHGSASEVDGDEWQSGLTATMQSTQVLPEAMSGRDSSTEGDAFNENRRGIYSKCERDGGSMVSAKEARVLQPAVDDFVNAKTRGFRCRRVPIMLAYSNDKRGALTVELLGITESATLATFMVVVDVRRRPLLSCDMCTPHLFEHLAAPAASQTTRVMKKSHIKPYDLATPDRDLRRALLDWRDIKALQEFDQATLIDYGSDIFMSVSTIQRVIDCAHAGKLSNLESLRRELDWDGEWTDSYGASLLELIASQAALLATPAVVDDVARVLGAADMAGAQLSTTAEVALPRKRRPPTCSSCGMTGHTTRSSKCRNRQAINVNNENIAPHGPIAGPSTSRVAALEPAFHVSRMRLQPIHDSNASTSSNTPTNLS